MRSLLLTILFCLCSSTALADLQVKTKGWEVYREGYIPDVTLDIGGFRSLPWRDNRGHFIIDTRIGVSYVREPWILSLGVLSTLTTLPTAGIGLQAEVMHENTGLWGEIAFSGNYTVHKFESAFVRFSCGWTFFGIEWQGDVTSDTRYLVLKAHLPLGLVAEELATKR